MSNEQNNEIKENVKVIAEETAQKVKDVGKAAAGKLDEYYNKLPLDKINEKLGGKIDVKSKKVKLIFFSTIAMLIVMILALIFFSGDTAVIEQGSKNIGVILKLDNETYAAYNSVLFVNKECRKKITPEYGKETFVEFIERCKKQYNEKELASFNEYYKTNIKNVEAQKAILQKKFNIQANAKNRRAYIEKNAPALVNESLDESFDTCQKVEMDKAPAYDKNTDKCIDEWWNGVATLYNSQTGKSKKRVLEVKYIEDLGNGKITLITTLKNERP